MPAAPPQSSSGGEAQHSVCTLETRGQESGGFVWTVHNFSKISDKEFVSAPGCCLGGVQWRLLMYTYGDEDLLKPEEVGKFLSVYLEVHNAADLPEGWKRSVSYKLTLRSHRDGSWQALPDAPSVGELVPTFRARFVWGEERFLALSELNDPTKGFLHNDTLTIEVQIVVYHDLHQAERIQHLQKYVESLYGDEATSDAEVRVGGASFLTHKFVLGQAPFFQTKFATEVGEGASGRQTRSAAAEAAASPSARAVVTLKPEEVTPDAFKVVLESLYKVDTPPTFPHGLELLEVHAAANFLGLSVLQRACEAVLGEEELSVEVLVPYLCYASLHGLTALKEKCFAFATESEAQLSDFMAMDSFLAMANEDRELYLEFVQHLSTVLTSKGKKRKR